MTKDIIALTEKTPAPATLLAALRTGGSDLGISGGSLVWTYRLTWLDDVWASLALALNPTRRRGHRLPIPECSLIGSRRLWLEACGCCNN
ncbi:hypothetical protein ACFYZB_39920 [Streptomyces sp. NPDC001852]|uniref:hypothetical protein n=1 Tax=Streptomyces sp. NPDC001852 TaxID=3364619 RepID=UPI00369EC431